MVKLEDVARAAGVSLSTVSRVLNGHRSVRPETRAHVQAVMAKLGYRPNQVARAMVRGRTQTIGLIVSDITNPFYAETARVVVNQARSHGYDVILCNTDDDPSIHRQYVQVLQDKQVDGIICASARLEDPALEGALEMGIPVVAYNRRLARADSHFVVVDNVLGAYQATEHLMRLGHRHIAFLSGPPQYSTGKDRLGGFLAAIHAAGLCLPGDWVRTTTFHHQEAYRIAMEWLSQQPRPTAIFAATDQMALGVIDCALEQGLRIPDDLSVLGFDDIDMACHRTVQLTTMAQRKDEMAQLALKAMVEVLQGDRDGTPIQVVLRPQLRVRNTTGPVPANRISGLGW